MELYSTDGLTHLVPPRRFCVPLATIQTVSGCCKPPDGCRPYAYHMLIETFARMVVAGRPLGTPGPFQPSCTYNALLALFLLVALSRACTRV